MITPELTALITHKYQEGKKRSQIREELLAEGFSEADIDESISHIHTEAIKQLPLIAPITKFIDKLEHHSSDLSPKTTAAILAGCGIFILIIAFGLYFFFDPLGSKNVSQDAQRESDVIKIRTAVDSFYTDNKLYPTELNELVPQYLDEVPYDPENGSAYNYTVKDGNRNYELCVTYEGRPPQCAASSNANSIPVVSTPTPTTSFAPKTASPASDLQLSPTVPSVTNPVASPSGEDSV